jgi:hypothetical protein
VVEGADQVEIFARRDRHLRFAKFCEEIEEHLYKLTRWPLGAQSPALET